MRPRRTGRSSSTDSSSTRANETRPELAKLFEMCDRNDCACIIIVSSSACPVETWAAMAQTKAVFPVPLSACISVPLPRWI